MDDSPPRCRKHCGPLAPALTERSVRRSRKHRVAVGPIVVAALASIVLFAGGCTGLRQWARNGFKVGPNYGRPPAAVAAEWIDSPDSRIQSAPVQDCAWWAVFHDPTLDALIEMAYRQNLSLRAAGARILEARALRNVAVGNLLPQSQTAVGAYAHGQITQNINVPLPNSVNLWVNGFNASWELDFWGRYRRNVEAANADWEASIDDYGDTLIMLLAEVASTYVELRTFEQRLDYARRNIGIQQGSLQLAQDRFAKGMSTELDVRQARTSLAQTQAAVAPLQAGRRKTSNRLCILLGMPVDDLATRLVAAPIPTAPPEIAVGLPADLLRRRPDIRRAERQVAGQSARIGVAESDLYPRLALNGFLGYAADDIEKLFASKSFTGFIIPTVQWNILNYGRIANNIVAEDARLQKAALEYQQSVLDAGREVEDALVGFLQAERQARWLEDGVGEAQRSVELVMIQFDGGITDFNRVFNTQSVLVSQQDQLALVRGDIALNLIAAYKALGGGWRYVCRTGSMPMTPPAEYQPAASGGPEELPPQPPGG